MKCPNCGETITNGEIINTEFYHGAYYDYMEDSCEKCNKFFTWSEVFKYSHDEDITELKECPIY